MLARLRVALIYHASSATPANVREILTHICSDSRDLQWMQVNLSQSPDLSFACKIDHFVVHNTACYFPSDLERLLKNLRQLSPDVPITVMKQDEHVAPYLFDEMFVRHGVTNVFTCVPVEHRTVVYRESCKVGIEFVTMHTGYVLPSLSKRVIRPDAIRNRLSFRGSLQPISTGQMGKIKAVLPEFLNTQISDSMAKSWYIDASSAWTDRVYGEAWFDLLDRSAAVVGTPSGSTVFDLDGSLAATARRLGINDASTHWGLETSTNKEWLDAVALRENTVPYSMFAPRHIEAALIQRPQVLTEGNYHKILTPNTSFVPLRSDASDLNECLEKLSDLEYRRSIAVNSKEEILSQTRLRISSLTESLRAVILAAGIQTANGVQSRNHPRRAPRAVVLASTLYTKDPRHSWWIPTLVSKGYEAEMWQALPNWKASNGKARDIRVTRVEIDVFGLSSTLQTSSTTAVASRAFVESWIDNNSEHPAAGLVLQLLRMQNHTTNQHALDEAFLHILQFAALLATIEAGDIETIVACDLRTAFAASVLVDKSQTRVIYDAQESFVDQYETVDKPFDSQVKNIWMRIDRFAWENSSSVVSVSPELARLYLDRFGVNSVVIPNFPPKGQAVVGRDDVLQYPVRFVYLGDASPYRGLEELIDYWKFDANHATLDLFVPRSIDRDKLIRRLQQKDLRKHNIAIAFRQAVPEAEMVQTLAEFDVGIVPYNYGYPYNHCSPNKFGLYMAAGLAILTNDLEFVAGCVLEDQSGVIFSWDQATSFESKCMEFLDLGFLRASKRNASQAFLTRRNWEESVNGEMEGLNTRQRTSLPPKYSVPANNNIRDVGHESGDRVYVLDGTTSGGMTASRPIALRVLTTASRLATTRVKTLVPRRFRAGLGRLLRRLSNPDARFF